MSRKTVSVVMATYNGSEYLGKQLESLSSQTVQPDEILVSDDGSTDDTLSIVERFKQKSPFEVRVIERGRNVGFRDNFLMTAAEAQGDFIAFCDQDDIWKPNKLERCRAYFDDPTISMIVHTATLIDRNSSETGAFRQGITGTRIVPPLSYDPWGTFWGFSIVFRRDLLRIHPMSDRFRDYIAPEHLIAHDRWITFLAQVAGAVAQLDEPLVWYRQHDSNVFGQGPTTQMTTTNQIANRSRVYIEATMKMVDIVRALDASALANFPLLDRRKSIEFFERALAQLRARDAIYRSETRFEALKAACRLAGRKGYVSVNGDRMRWKSFVRDLQFALTRS